MSLTDEHGRRPLGADPAGSSFPPRSARAGWSAPLGTGLGSDRDELNAEVARLRGLLARLEWAGTNPRNPVNPHCPACGGWPANGHGRGCWLAAELGRQP